MDHPEIAVRSLNSSNSLILEYILAGRGSWASRFPRAPFRKCPEAQEAKPKAFMGTLRKGAIMERETLTPQENANI
jgi:hypothetical protein